jgi:inorganic triphosphatase YgiF
MKSGSQDREIEATLVIRSEKAQIVANEIANLDSIGDYRLLPQNPEKIHDLYFDIPSRALQKQKLALRVRGIGTDRWIALKGPSQATDWGGVDRLEIELPWSEDTLDRILKELIDRGIRISQQHQDSDNAHPLDVMASLGLQVIQDREDRREIRNIVRAGERNGPVLAEMVIDRVVYHLSGREILHHEIEIEAKEGDAIVIDDVAEGLLAMYEPALRRWDHGKLATGKAIEKMLTEGILENLLDTNNNLKPVAYDTIGDYIRCGNKEHRA